MKGKIIPLRQHEDIRRRQKDGNPIGETEALLAGPLQEVEQVLWRASSRIPAGMRKLLVGVAKKGERICPALFLLIALPGYNEPGQIYRLAASLEALHLALGTHRGIADCEDLLAKEAILCGDFYFGLALTLAGNRPVFVQGMSEVITRFAGAAIHEPLHPADDLDPKGYLQRVCDGSASIFALSCTLGALQRSMRTEQNEALSHYGLYLGIGLQLRGEAENFKLDLHARKSLPRTGLPLIYTLNRSPLCKKVMLMDGAISDRKYDLLHEEIDRIDPWSYTDQIIGNCFSKAGQYIDLLQDSLDPKTMGALKSFLY